MDKWQSKGLYQHPVPRRKGTYGQVCLSEAGIYYLRLDGQAKESSWWIACPQPWAARIHQEENITILREACEAEGTPFSVVKMEEVTP